MHPDAYSLLPRAQRRRAEELMREHDLPMEEACDQAVQESGPAASKPGARAAFILLEHQANAAVRRLSSLEPAVRNGRDYEPLYGPDWAMTGIVAKTQLGVIHAADQVACVLREEF